jgi:hypothetical protein
MMYPHEQFENKLPRNYKPKSAPKCVVIKTGFFKEWAVRAQRAEKLAFKRQNT